MPEQKWPDSRYPEQAEARAHWGKFYHRPPVGSAGGRDPAPGRTGERLAARVGRLGFPARELAGLVSALPVVLAELEILI